MTTDIIYDILNTEKNASRGRGKPKYPNAGGAEGDYMKKFLALFLAIVMAMSLGLLTSCGETAGTSEACAHTETEWVVTREATCTVDGVEKQKCKKCGKIVGENKVIPKLGHEFVAGFCDRAGCNTADPENNKFYADMVISMADSDRVIVKNSRDIVIKTDMNNPEKDAEYKITDIDFLSGRSEGVTGEDGKETGVKQLIQGKIESDIVSGTLSIVASENEVKLVVKNAGAEVAYARVDGEAAKKVISGMAGLIPDIGGGSVPGVGGMDLSAILDTLRKADGTDATVKQINTLLHNLVMSVASVSETETETGYKFVLDYEKAKELNHALATQTVKAFVDNLFGENTFESYVPSIITLAVQSDSSLTEEEQAKKISEINGNLREKSVYEVIGIYGNVTESAADIEKSVNDVLDALKGIEVSANTDKKGNVLSFKLAFDNWEFASGSDGSSAIQLPSVHIDGEIEIKLTKQRVTGDEYLPFEETEKLHDTAGVAAGTYDGTSTSMDIVSVKYTVAANGDIVKAETVYRESSYDAETEQTSYTYYKVVNENPVAVLRSTNDSGITYKINNLLVADTGNGQIILGTASVKVYEVSEDGTELRTLTEAEITDIAYMIDEVEFTLAVVG